MWDSVLSLILVENPLNTERNWLKHDSWVFFNRSFVSDLYYKCSLPYTRLRAVKRNAEEDLDSRRQCLFRCRAIYRTDFLTPNRFSVPLATALDTTCITQAAAGGSSGVWLGRLGRHQMKWKRAVLVPITLQSSNRRVFSISEPARNPQSQPERIWRGGMLMMAREGQWKEPRLVTTFWEGEFCPTPI